MPQVIEFPPVGAGPDVRAALGELVRVCKETQDGDSFRDLRARLRQAKLWEPARPRVALRFLGAGGKTIARSPFMTRVAEAAGDDAAFAVVAERLFELNPLLAKAIVDLVAQRAYGKDEIYKVLGSVAYKGKVPSRPDLDSWLQIALAAGVLKPVGIAVAAGPRFEGFAKTTAGIDADEFLAEDRPEPEPEIPADEDAAPAAALPAIDSTARIDGSPDGSRGAAIATSPIS
jgi:hypothetical protein